MCISPKVNLSVKQPARLKVLSVVDPQYQFILNNSNDNVERLHAQRQQEFLDREPVFDKTITIEQFGYPTHLLEFKKALAQLAGGQTLKVSSQSAILIDDLAASCRALNLPVETRQFRRFHYLYAGVLSRFLLRCIRSRNQQSARRFKHWQPINAPPNLA